jgi:hypothetical protein
MGEDGRSADIVTNQRSDPSVRPPRSLKAHADQDFAYPQFVTVFQSEHPDT